MQKPWFEIRDMVAFCMYYFIVIFTAVSYVVAIKRCQNCNQFREAGPRFPYNGRRNNPKTQSITTIAVPRRRRRCCPYDFDSSICRILDDRVLCGYNKNIGYPKSKNDIEQLDRDCRFRGGRLECGYEYGPFTNPRRPPVWDNPPPGLFPSQNDDAGNDVGNAGPRNFGQVKRSANTDRPKRVTRCMEMADNRIACREV